MEKHTDTVLWMSEGGGDPRPIYSCDPEDPDKDDMIADLKSDNRRRARASGVPSVKFTVIEGYGKPKPVIEPASTKAIENKGVIKNG